MPASAPERAKARHWLQQLDTGLHLDIAAISIAIAFRDQLKAVHNAAEALEAYFAAIPDPNLRDVYKDLVLSGIESSNSRMRLKVGAQRL